MVFSAIAREIGRLIRGALPFAVVDNNPGGIISTAISHRTVQSAIDEKNNLIFIKAGTYPKFDCDNANTLIIGSHGVLIDGGTSGDAITVSAAGCTVIGIRAKTTPGGGTAYVPVKSTGANATFLDVTGDDADGTYAFTLAAEYNRIIACRLADGDSSGFAFYGGDRGIAIGNQMDFTGYYGIVFTYPSSSGSNEGVDVGNLTRASGTNVGTAPNAEDCLIVGNSGDSTCLDVAGTGTIASNETW